MSWWFPGLSHFQIFHLNAGAEFPISASLGGMQKGALYTLAREQHFSIPTFVYLKTHGPNMIKCVFLSGDLTSDYAFYHHTMYFFLFLFFLEWLSLWLGVICQREYGYFCALSFLFRFQNQMPTSYFI